MGIRICQICHTEHPLEEYYTKDVYICRKCNTFLHNISNFKKLIKTKGVDFATKLLMKEERIIQAKYLILSGKKINDACRESL